MPWRTSDLLQQREEFVKRTTCASRKRSIPKSPTMPVRDAERLEEESCDFLSRMPVSAALEQYAMGTLPRLKVKWADEHLLTCQACCGASGERE